MKKIKSILISLFAMVFSFNAALAADKAGSKEQPLRVMLVPADGGTEDGTLADFRPLFSALTQSTGLHFDMKVGQSYSAVRSAMANRQADIAWFGPVSYLEAKKRGAELLALSVKKETQLIFLGFLYLKERINSLADLKDKDIAFGDPHSTSSFVYPMAMILRVAWIR